MNSPVRWARRTDLSVDCAVPGLVKRWHSALLPALLFASRLVCADQEIQPAPPSYESLQEFLSAGKLDIFLRYRFENVDDGLGPPPLQNADAHTLRSVIGYDSALWHGFGARLQIEDVHSIGREKYNDGGSNGVLDRAVVADPEGTEVQQANLRYEGLSQTTLRLGRQEIEHRQAPLHRYVGNILWRQNWQSFDAFRASNRTVRDLAVDYAYLWNVNRMFGEDNPIPDRDDYRMDGHALNAQYTGLRAGKVELYAYLLDFTSSLSEHFSTQTYGARFDGSWPIAEQTKILYVAEYARQGDYQENPNDIGVDYFLGELGASYAREGALSGLTAKISFEVLGGDGGFSAFQTPLGTNHAFQGWADRFLITPGDGIQDLFVTVRATILGATAMAVYHDLNSDQNDYDYGTEWDLLLEKTFLDHYTVGIKYANYDADRNALNVSRNSLSGQAFDLAKFWAWLQFVY